MGPVDPTDDPSDADYSVNPRRGVWTANYLRKFTNLLIENTVVLQSLQGCMRDDPLHQLRKRAMEHMREELAMSSTDQLKGRICAFKKFVADKMRLYADKYPQHNLENILKSAPRWLRELEPHLNSWAQIASRKANNQKTLIESTPPATPATDSAGWLAGTGRSTGLALALVQKAREVHTLDARAVCMRMESVPREKREDLQHVWWRMLDVVRQKLSLHRDAGDVAEYMQGARFTPVESMLADLVLLLDDTICTVSENSDYKSMQALVALFHLAQLHRLEESDVSAESWRRAHSAYRARNLNVRGLCSSVILMQRRWHELKLATKRSITAYTRDSGETLKPPSPLYAAIAKRFPHIVTEPLLSWREVVNSGAVIEDDESEGGPQSEVPLALDELDDMRSVKELVDYERTAKDDEEDLVLIEKEIETIDLINMSDEQGGSKIPIQDYAFDDQMQQKLRKKRKNFAQQLEKELDRQLKDFDNHDGVSEMTLLEEPRTQGAPMFIFDSDSDVECTEDRNRNIELIASQIGDEGNVDQIAIKIKKEIIKEVDCDEPAAGISGDDGNRDEGLENADNDCVAIDEKLLMDTRINLFMITETPQWKSHAKHKCSIDINELDLTLFQPKRTKHDVFGTAQELTSETIETIKVKVEPIDDDSSDKPKGERQVKSMAKRLISEIMRDESDNVDTASRSRACVRKVRELIDVSDESSKKVPKKVQLPNIEDVRKNNLSLLTAQVAPLTTDGTEGEGEMKGGEGTQEMEQLRLSLDSSDDLLIDEGPESREADNLTLTRSELRSVLQRLEKERVATSVTYWLNTPAQGSPSHCCTARRQHALNSARRRVAARAGRQPPTPVDIHATSNCTKDKKCLCCCKHLLAEGDAGAKLQQEAKEIDAALRRLLDNNSNESTERQESGDTEKSNNKTAGIKRPKKKKDETISETNEVAVDPLQEWIRQKNLNQQYFNLNLKTKPQPQEQTETQSETDKPTNALNTNVTPEIVHDNLPKGFQKHSPLILKKLKKVSIPSAAKLIPCANLQRINPSTETLNKFHEIKSVIDQTEMSTIPQVVPETNALSIPNICVPFSKSQIRLNKTNTIPTSANFIAATKTVLGGTIVKLRPVTTSNQVKPVSSTFNQGKIVPLSSIQVKAGQNVNSLLLPNIVPVVTTQKSNMNVITMTHKNALNISKSITTAAKPGSLESGKANQVGPCQTNQVGPGQASQTTPAKEGTIANQKNNMNVISMTHKNALNVSKSITIAAKPGPLESGKANQVGPCQTNQVGVGQASQTRPAKEGTIANQKNNMNVISTTHKNTSNISKPIRIAPKPSPPISGQANQVGPCQTNPVGPGQVSQTSPAKGNQLTYAKAIVGRKTSEQQSIDSLRGTSSKLIKASSASSSSLPVLSEPWTLQDDPQQIYLKETKKVVVISKNGMKTTKTTMQMKQVQGGGAILTKRTRFKNLSASSSFQKKIEIFDLQSHFQRNDLTMPLDEFLKGKDPTRLMLQCFDANSPFLTLLHGYYILTETDLSFKTPSYWPLSAVPVATRLIIENTNSKSCTAVALNSNSNSEVMSSPDKMCLGNKVYVKLKNAPLLYAKIMCVVRTAAECHQELMKNASLYIVQARTGDLVTLARQNSNDPNTLALSSPYETAAKALADILNQLSTQPEPSSVPVPARVGVNARADVVMMMNNVNRVPIEMVDIDSDDDSDIKKEPQFKGLEHFEDIDDFEL